MTRTSWSQPVSNLQTEVTQDTTDTDTLKPYQPTRWGSYDPDYRFGNQLTEKTQFTPIFFSDPSHLELDISFDTTLHYSVFEKLGDLQFRPPTSMTFEEYDQYHDKELERNYWKEKSSALDGESAVGGRRLIPPLYISPVFDRIFGGSYIDLQVNGFINLDFGGNFQKVDNPALTRRQQSFGNFNFNRPQISMNLVGKVGEKLEIKANYDNNNTFAFQNNMRFEFTGYEEDIIKKIILGNVSMPVSNSLMSGSQSLFGVKTELQFGKLFFTGVLSRKQGTISSSTLGNASNIDEPKFNATQQEENEIRASGYDENRHFFLSHYFRDNYEKWVSDPRNIISGLNIANIEVYITNTNNNTQTTRNTVGFIDLGEAQTLLNERWANATSQNPTHNAANTLYSTLISSGFRNSNSLYEDLKTLGMIPDEEYIVTGASRQLEMGSEFIVNKSLGYITLLAPLNDNQSLSVAYQYALNGQIYSVGELSNERRLPDDQSLFVKLIRPNKLDTQLPTWDLMMKNIYNLNTSNINSESFLLRIKYKDDNSGIDNPYLHEGGAGIENEPLIKLLGLDQYNLQLDPQPDGVFDFIEGVTINSSRGFLIFPVLEPFGSTLKSYFNPASQANLIENYVYENLYSQTKQIAVTDTRRDKYRILFAGTGQQGSGGTSGTTQQNNVIKLEGFPITEGSVVVRMGNVTLEEGTHYTVNYNFGTVTIIDSSVLNSGIPITATSEAADLFNIQTTWFYGGHFDYRFNEKMNLGATILHLNERRGGISRFTVGNEPMRNTLFGFDFSIQEESRFLTKMVDALPLVSTKTPSTVNFTAEYARFIPGTSNDVQGAPTSYIEDFDNAASPLNLNGWFDWRLASTPKTEQHRFYNQNLPIPDRAFNYKKAKIAWYTIDNSAFYRSNNVRPSNLSDEELQNHYVRAVLPQEIFRERDAGQININEPLFDVAFFPEERGQQNYTTDLNAEGRLKNPEQNWGGIMRGFQNETNFLNSNFQYIEFWLMDPFIDGDKGRVLDGILNQNNTTGGKLLFNLGSVSEDVVPDGAHFFENGLPTPVSATPPTVNPFWGNTPATQFLTPFFPNDAASRDSQDVGFDGLTNTEENTFFNDYLNTLDANVRNLVAQDVSADNFQYYLGSDFDAQDANIIERYKNYNGTDGNSPFNTSGSFSQASSTKPDNEDINGDNTLSFLEEYFEYTLDLNKNQMENNPFVIDQITNNNGESTWYQFRIPLDKFTGVYGDPSFQNIRFLRMYLTGWKEPVVLRFANLQMTRSTWRKYPSSLRNPDLIEIPETNLQNFDISVVNIEENSTGNATQPPYVVPPGLDRDVDNTQTVNIRFNEQSLQLCVENLDNGDARAAFKNQIVDLINYERLKLFFHLHDFKGSSLKDYEMSGFIRLGQDNDNNYYEIEVPLKVTPKGLTPNTSGLDRWVWPLENEINLSLDLIRSVKVDRDRKGIQNLIPYKRAIPNTPYIVTVVGNPEMNNLQTMMVGLRNIEGGEIDDRLPKSACLWVNEIRAEGYEKQSGWAANATFQATLADVMTINANTRYSTIGFGGLSTTIAQRNRFENLSYQASAQVNVEKFLFPEKTGLKIPLMVNYQRERVTPQYDPLNQDILLKESLQIFENDEERKSYEKKIISDTESRGINVSISKSKVKEGAKNHFYDIENFTLSYAYSDVISSNHLTASKVSKQESGNLSYQYSFPNVSVSPLSKVSFLSNPYFQLLKDINFSILPSNFSFTANLSRNFDKTQFYNKKLTTEGITPNYQRVFNFGRTYGLGWNITQNLNFTYTANVRAVIDEPESIIDGDINTPSEKKYIWNQILALGRMKSYDHNLSLNYKIPFDKFPLTSWITTNVQAATLYNWTAGPINQTDSKGNSFGNNLQNSRQIGVNGSVNLTQLLDKMLSVSGMSKEKTTKISQIIMPIKSLSGSFTQNESTTLPGFLPQLYMIGLDNGFNAPGLPFVLGSQNPNIRFKAAQNNWLTKSPFLSSAFTQSQSQDFNVSGTIDLFKVVNIQFDFLRNNTNSYQEIFRYDTLSQNYQTLTPSRSGSYKVSFIPIASAFEKKPSDFSSSAFSRFENNIKIFQQRMNAANNKGEYEALSQDILIPAFLAAYANRNPNTSTTHPVLKIPLPNWRINFSGLSNLPFIKKIFNSFTLSHGYTASYTIGNYTANLKYSDALSLDNSIFNYPLAYQLDEVNNKLIPKYIINQVLISEQFSPLISLNFTTKNNITTRFGYNKGRNLALNLSNAQVSETNNEDFNFSLGFVKRGLKMPFRISGRTVVLDNTINFQTNFSIRNTQTIQRKINGENVATNGTLVYQINPTLAYKINEYINLTMYYTQSIFIPKVLSSFRRSTSSFGVQIRISLAQ